MTNVIYIADFIAARNKRVNALNGVRPKSEARSFSGQRYTLTFDPNAPTDKRWRYTVKFTRVYEYYGSAADIEKADKAAKKHITQLIERTERESA